ncbi:hypothetical protein [Nocardiopsis salina]|uniref:hypothetical protein n=1 Tax=Nocardiopsis salina TaxID=245836 RepID=UPI0003464359|nr:hypothetical protein [Nocardiopsis salina]
MPPDHPAEEPAHHDDLEPAAGSASGPALAVLARVAAWWLVRLAAPLGVLWVLWRVLPPTVTVPAAVALLLISAALLAPGDLRKRPVAAPGALVVAWDLVLLATVTTLWTVQAHPHGLALTAVVPVLLGLGVRLRTWSDLTAPPSHTPGARVPLRAGALALAAVLALAVLSPLYRDGPAHALECSALASAPGGGQVWDDAEVLEGAPPQDHPALGEALWRSDRQETLTGGHGDTVTMIRSSSDEEGLAVRAADDGRVLWHVDADRIASDTSRAQVRTDRVHQVGGTVVAGFHGTGETAMGEPKTRTVGYDAATGRMQWCASGLWELTADVEETERFAARRDGPYSSWSLYAATDGSEVARLPADGDTDQPDHDNLGSRAHMSGGRVTVHTVQGFTTYDLATAEPVTAAVDLTDRFDLRPVQDVTHVDDVTVAAFAESDDHDGPERGHERHGVAAYGPGGEYLWDSFGTGPLEEGEPLVGSGFGACDEPEGEPRYLGFDGHFLALDTPGNDRRVAGVRAADGTVTWLSGDQHSFADCSWEQRVIDGDLVADTGDTVGADGPVTGPLGHPDSTQDHITVLMFAGNGTATGHPPTSPVVFHALP